MKVLLWENLDTLSETFNMNNYHAWELLPSIVHLPTGLRQ